jgi:hypothetical protein
MSLFPLVIFSNIMMSSRTNCNWYLIYYTLSIYAHQIHKVC